MKKIYFLAIVTLLSIQLFAQFPMGGAGMKPGQAPPAIGNVYGKLVDSVGKPISDASVVMLQNKMDTVSKKRKDVLIKAVVTKANGEFNFSELPVFGGLKLKISAIGFKPIEKPVAFQMKMEAPATAKPSGDPAAQMGAMSGMLNSFVKDLGNIQLTSEAKVLENVTVSTVSSGLKLDIDKKVFSVEKNIVSAGGTAVDVMRNVPSVQVDVDGNVKLRNAAPQIYVDGRPTTLTLDQIPADAIATVEVITNPSAKFDASGGNAGILNIVLKKNKQSGYNGNIIAGIDRRGGVNAGGNFSVRQNKVNFTAAVMMNQMRNKSVGTTDRLNFGDTQIHVFQNNENRTKGAFVFGKVGLDYYVTNRATLSLSGIKVHGEFTPSETIDITSDSLFNSGIRSLKSQRITTGSRTFNANGLQAGYVYNFHKAGEQLTADGNFFSGKNGNNSLYTTNYLKGANVSNTQLQQMLGEGTNRFLTVQTDYTNPISTVTKLEAGLRAQLRNTTSNIDNYRGSANASLVKIPSATSNYKNDDNVYAGYVSVKSAIKDFGYQIGVRAESSNYNGELTNTGQKFSNKYPVSLFPSLFLSQKFSKKQELQFSYTRRVNRPNFFQLIPYTDYTDSLNISRGNPNLVPEFTSSFEMSYGKTFKGNNNILGSIYYKHSTNLITRYFNQEINPYTGKLDIISSFINANSSYSYGAEVTSVNYLAKWWDVTTNLNLYQSKINTDNIIGTSQAAMVSWFGKFNSNFRLPAGFAIQLSADYQSKTNLPINNNQGGGFGGGGGFGQAQSSSQGYIRPFWGMDLAVRKSFLKNNAGTVSVSFSDMFRTRKQDQHSESKYFIQDYYRLSNPQMVRVNFSYRFGKMDISLFKRQNLKSTGTQDAMQMGQ
ncbi:MAG: TonB-dependent receptor [Bacteroidota bacterium]|nr:TonB-dependent receptor [Bacteroidota bacterium]